MLFSAKTCSVYNRVSVYSSPLLRLEIDHLLYFHFPSPSFLRIVNVLKHFSVFSTLVTLKSLKSLKSLKPLHVSA
jgi:hypothetical protein